MTQKLVDGKLEDLTLEEEVELTAKEARSNSDKANREQAEQDKANAKSAAETRIKAKLKINDTDLDDLKKVLL